MPEKYSPPVFNQKTFNCPRCGAFAAQDWRRLFYWDANGNNQLAHDHGFADQLQGTPEGVYYEGWPWVASMCAGCDDMALWIDERLVFPTTDALADEVPEPNPDMPVRVIGLYREAAAVLPHSRRAAAALCRAALEALAKHLTQDLDSASNWTAGSII
ncbi:hypothetical protein [Paenarthrobacter sp. NPDC090522]|uniref:hypothetical protein n=1 Tax=Paenarthrobacter sp. NPDC090522 TaxID=3364383 RepID=UPI00382346A1